MMKQLHEVQGNEYKMRGETGERAGFLLAPFNSWMDILPPAAIVLNGLPNNSWIPFYNDVR